MVELRDVHYRSGDAHIIRGVSVAFRPHKLNVVLGPNGAGKTTLIKLATGLLTPTQGEVRYGSRSVAEIGVEELARCRAVLSQHVEMAFPLPVEEVVLMGRYPHYGRTPSRRDREIVKLALELVEMSDFRRRSYPTLSGGEQQKVQLARVLAQIWKEDSHTGESYLFLDEPTSNLDIYYELHLLDTARALLQRDCTIIASLHNVNQALRYGDAFFLVDHGQLAQVADDAGAISTELIERVFRVRARWATDSETGQGEWRFSSRAVESEFRLRTS